MKIYRNSDCYDWTGHVYATDKNVKVGDSVKVIRIGYPSVRVSDGVVMKVTGTTIHVKHESAYPQNGKWHIFETTTIFRKHTRNLSSEGVFFRLNTTIYKVNEGGRT